MIEFVRAVHKCVEDVLILDAEVLCNLPNKRSGSLSLQGENLASCTSSVFLHTHTRAREGDEKELAHHHLPTYT